MTVKSEQLQIRITPAQKAALKRRAGAAGQDMSAYVLARALPAHAARFSEILSKLRDEGERRFVLAELNDFLSSLARVQFPEAVAHADLEGLSLFLRNYVAAMVEQAAGQKGVAPPAWARDVPALEQPHFATPLKGLRLHLLRASPVAFRRRNIFVDAGVGARV